MTYSQELLAEMCQTIRSNGKKIVFTNGCFDILHAGHVTYLAEAKKHGDFLVLGLNSDSSVRRLKGESRPINSEYDRALVLSGLRSVDFVCIFDEETPLSLIEALKPDVLIKGGDYSLETIVGAKETLERGGTVLTIPLLAGRSTTAILAKAAAPTC